MRHLLYALGLAVTLCSCASAPWFKYGSNTANNGRASDSNATGIVAWTFDSGGPIASNPVLDSNGTVYITSTTSAGVGSLRAVDNAGNGLWSFNVSSPMRGTPGVEDGRVFVGSDDHNAYGVDAKTGNMLWHFTTGDRIVAAPVPAGGSVYIASLDGKLYALDPATGVEQWRYSTDAQFQTAPAMSPDGTLYICGSDRKVYAINAATHNLVWMFQAGGNLTGAPAVGVINQTVYVGSDDGLLHALNPVTGNDTAPWPFNAGTGGSWATPSVIYLGANKEVVYAVKRRTLVALDALSATVLWRDPAWFAGYDYTSQPAVVPNGLLFLSTGSTASGSSLVAVNSTNGAQIWKWYGGFELLDWPAVGIDGKVYVTSFNGKLTALK